MQLLLLEPVPRRVWPERLRDSVCGFTFDSWGVTLNGKYPLFWFPRKTVLRYIPKSPQGLESGTCHAQQELPLKTYPSFSEYSSPSLFCSGTIAQMNFCTLSASQAQHTLKLNLLIFVHQSQHCPVVLISGNKEVAYDEQSARCDVLKAWSPKINHAVLP